MSARRARLRRLAAALAVAACAPARVAPAPAPEAPPSVAVADRLFLGRAVGAAGEVSDADWGAFVRDVVTPLLADGLTVWRAEGQWRDPGGHVVRERVMVVEVVHARDPRVSAALAEVAREYRRRFAQEAVLRTTAPVELRVYGASADAVRAARGRP